MARSLSPAFIWQVKRIPAQLGIPGCIGVGILAFGIAFYVSAFAPERARSTELQRAADSLRMGRTPDAKKNDPVDQLAAFYRLLPKASTAPDWFNKLYEAAKAQNLALDQAEYRLSKDQDGKVSRYEVTLPVKGSYVQVRKFLNQALKDIPSLSLDSVTYQRQKVGDPVVESQIKFTLFLGGEGA